MLVDSIKWELAIRSVLSVFEECHKAIKGVIYKNGKDTLFCDFQ